MVSLQWGMEYTTQSNRLKVVKEEANLAVLCSAIEISRAAKNSVEYFIGLYGGNFHNFGSFTSQFKD